MTTEDYKILLPNIPREPGVYRFIDKDDVILYVGKAKNIRNRVSNYFGDKKQAYYKTKVLVKNAVRLEFTVVETEQDALLLENTLIKKFQPRYNVSLKDGKTYTYLCIKNERFPRIFFTRRVIKDGSVYYGPYTSKYRTKIIFDLVKKLFPLRNCNLNLSQKNIEADKFKVCLEYHIKNCHGPCVGHESQEEYDDKIDQIKNILKGNFKLVKDYITEQMSMHVANLDFEKAQTLKEKLEAFEDYQSKSTVVSNTIRDMDVFAIDVDEKYAYVNYMKIINGALMNTDTIEMEKNLNDDESDLLSLAIINLREKFNSICKEIIVTKEVIMVEDDVLVTIPQRGDKRKLLDLAEKNLKYYILQKKKDAATRAAKQTPVERILKTMRDDLQMEELPYHLECFDNSNLGGSYPVASCVVFKNGKPSKRDYRHFKIKTVEGPNDFASMEEIVYRRYSRLLKEGKSLPQLIVVDGGKGQLSATMISIDALGLRGKITVIGIAKRLEEIFFPEDPIPLYINKKSETLKIIQQARNEAHRFAINFHRDLRSKDFVKTELTLIPGIGEKTSESLLTQFGSVKNIKTTDLETLQSIAGKAAGQKVFNYFRSQQDKE